ncbi:hypothetical protein ACFXTN_008660 [Malus domestica]
MSATPNSSDSPSPSPANPNFTPNLPHNDVSNPSIMSIGSISIANVAGMVLTTLNRQNYITWHSLFIPVLKRFKLFGLVNGKDLCHPQFVRNSSGDYVLNDSFKIWCERDQILTIWINSTLFEDLFPLTIGMVDSRSLWLSLERRFSGASHTHVHSLRSKIQKIQKGDSSMTDFLHSIKDISNKLAAAGEPLSESDLVAYILSGLPDEYESFIDSIKTRNESVTADELHGLLLSKEISLQKRKTRASSSSTTPFHVYAAQSTKSGVNSNRGNWNNNFRNRNHNRSNQNRNSGGNKSNNWHNNTSNGLLGASPTSQNFGQSSLFGRFVQCQLCLQYGHWAPTCNRLSQFASSSTNSFTQVPTTMFSMTSSAPPSYWLTDSGASHHVTLDPFTLNSAIPYAGSDQLFVGDGKGLCISHTGSAIIRTKNASFRLNDVLLVPQASHNLLFVYKFVYDNWCSLTFDPFGFYVKDLRTGKMLFQGPSEGGLYSFYWNASNGVSGIAISPIAFMIAKADIHIWHRRLGHPSRGVLHSVVHKNNLPVIGFVNNLSVCTAYQFGKASRLPFSSLPCISTRPLQLLHMDVWGPSPTSSYTGVWAQNISLGRV